MIDIATPFDDAAEPDVRLRCIADQLAGMHNAGELDAPTAATLRMLGMLPILLLDICGDVFALRKPTGRVVRLTPALAVIDGGKA